MLSPAQLYPAVCELVRDRGRTLDWLAYHTGLRLYDLSVALRGTRPSFPVIIKICAALQISLAELEQAMLAQPEVSPCPPTSRH